MHKRRLPGPRDTFDPRYLGEGEVGRVIQDSEPRAGAGVRSAREGTVRLVSAERRGG
jgi:hypothetical protein